jgi:APA family basic amino acid/polyamine antiporter
MNYIKQKNRRLHSYFLIILKFCSNQTELFFMSTTTPEFKPSLGLLDATMIVAGSMIGSGIFIVSADITRNVGSTGWLVAVWLITGFMTLIAALSYGELSAMFPKAGGQ